MSDEPRLPLGEPAPDCLLPNGRYLHELRGQPVLLAFAPEEWNPAHAHQSTIFTQLLGAFDAGSSAPEAVVSCWHSLSCHGPVAAQFGVAGQRALLLLDEQGRLRWQTTIRPGHELRTGQVLAALEALRPDAPAPCAAAGEAAAGAALAPAGGGLSRRTFVTATLATAALLLLVGAAEAAGPVSPTETQPPMPAPEAATVPVTLTINGEAHRLEVEPRVVLLDALRENLHLTGTKKGCDHGQCGACTVHLDGHSALSCLTLAVMSEGRKITTIEGLAQGETLHPMQAAFVKHDAFQCGYCTPGQIMAATALVQDKQRRSAAEIREAMSGNLCRCAAYPNIIAAIQEIQTA
ncbi:2Fe-2S iron-sulfur cluster-binding protein [Hymenobacter rigui]|uniref:2Fe-2S iron-sulfur cluster binding domain-containing protein n=1 Tax=Hymenobacter rigui TaxID=334424 RepID=A0A3R9MM23_9BACT|nr:2Fe-2S iron-sulfur cluster-binding protein [Hymenobacter rigui]RSK48944.1 2Fe-2S iron-sulfur cluster binding domain-containing protein [Hymenobacter rigui]